MADEKTPAPPTKPLWRVVWCANGKTHTAFVAADDLASAIKGTQQQIDDSISKDKDGKPEEEYPAVTVHRNGDVRISVQLA